MLRDGTIRQPTYKMKETVEVSYLKRNQSFAKYLSFDENSIILKMTRTNEVKYELMEHGFSTQNRHDYMKRIQVLESEWNKEILANDTYILLSGRSREECKALNG